MSLLRRAAMTGLVILALALPAGAAWAGIPDDGAGDGKQAGPLDRTVMGCSRWLDPAERAELRSGYRALMDDRRADGRAVTDEWMAQRRAAMDEWRAEWRGLVDTAGDVTPEGLAEHRAARDELRSEHRAARDELRSEHRDEMQELMGERHAGRADRP